MTSYVTVSNKGLRGTCILSHLIARVIHQTYDGSTSAIIRERSEQEDSDVNLLRVTTEDVPREGLSLHPPEQGARLSFTDRHKCFCLLYMTRVKHCEQN